MEIVVLSGKGGTGKTTVAIALSELMDKVTRVDCDVDAANMYMYYEGKLVEKKPYMGNLVAFVDYDKCNRCGLCTGYCEFDSIEIGDVDKMTCEGCGVCAIVCPQKAIELKPIKTAEMTVREVHNGKIVSAEMHIGSEGSGKLIAKLKKLAKEHTKEGEDIIIDGSPGIGCPVISSVTGSDLALMVVEPTKSGLSDYLRVQDLCDHFDIQTMVCINKYDINLEISNEIEAFCKRNDIALVGKIPFDDTVLKSIEELKPLVQYPESSAAKAVVEMWENIKRKLEE
ncbi:NADH-dependent phenylglyoxylate dehydrogenase subunit delta [Andreesenia angusta]|uniref:NADH-dependent phenylglyoxylate dehydrogenase subunit delta n=1 Tax=Andreesenia angusta TaxID=39480 RepID=A0A1S1VA13_9FIRM|nr:ATP-binding protein [Andreesenia angusta]OHW63412.1 NADH-dependent phenylglyoxylate dehydrogenase subunit delta [Andreesenia angusta]